MKLPRQTAAQAAHPWSPSSRRAWIEICMRSAMLVLMQSRPPRGGRGLKYRFVKRNFPDFPSPSSRRAWIEILASVPPVYAPSGRSPHGGRELKRSPHRYVAWHRPPPVPGPFGAGGKAFTGKKKPRCISAPWFFWRRHIELPCVWICFSVLCCVRQWAFVCDQRFFWVPLPTGPRGRRSAALDCSAALRVWARPLAAAARRPLISALVSSR